MYRSYFVPSWSLERVKKDHYCNWKNILGQDDQPDHKSCKYLTDLSQFFYTYTIHSNEVHRTITLRIEDSDYVEGLNEATVQTFDFDTSGYDSNNPDIDWHTIKDDESKKR